MDLYALCRSILLLSTIYTLCFTLLISLLINRRQWPAAEAKILFLICTSLPFLFATLHCMIICMLSTTYSLTACPPLQIRNWSNLKCEHTSCDGNLYYNMPTIESIRESEGVVYRLRAADVAWTLQLLQHYWTDYLFVRPFRLYGVNIPSPFAKLKARCIDFMNDTKHCGRLYNKCQYLQHCLQGVCTN